MPPVEFEPTISAGERPQTYALDRAATGTGNVVIILTELSLFIHSIHFLIYTLNVNERVANTVFITSLMIRDD